MNKNNKRHKTCPQSSRLQEHSQQGDVRNDRKFGALIPTKQTTEKLNRIIHGKRCYAIRVLGLFKMKSFDRSTHKMG